MTIVFLKFLAQKYRNAAFLVKNTQIRHCWSQIEAFLFLHKILQLDKFEGADFKYGNSFLNFQPKNIQNHTFLVSNLDIFVFSRNLPSGEYEGADFKYDNNFFQIPAQKHQNKAFLVPNLKILILHQTLQQDQIEGADLKHDNNIFKLQPRNTQIRHFWFHI